MPSWVQYFFTLGLDTRSSSSSDGVYQHDNMATELDIRRPDSPYVLQNPWMCDYFDESLQIKSGVKIDRGILPVRDLFSAAESREAGKRKVDLSEFGNPQNLSGGLRHIKKSKIKNLFFRGIFIIDL